MSDISCRNIKIDESFETLKQRNNLCMPKFTRIIVRIYMNNKIWHLGHNFRGNDLNLVGGVIVGDKLISTKMV